MADDDDGICGCIILLVVLYVIYEGVKWAISKYGLEPIAAILGTIITVIVAISICKKIWDGATYLIDEGKAFVKFGMIWFITIFIVSVLIEWLVTYQGGDANQNKGASILLISIFLNMPGTSIMFYKGVKELKSCELRERITEGRKIIYFAVFWLIFWIFIPDILVSRGIIENTDIGAYILFVATPGTIANIIIGIWSTRVNLRKGWEDLNDAQITLRRQQETFDTEKNRIRREQEELQREHEELQGQQKELQKQLKGLQKLKNDISKETKEVKAQREEIQKARNELEKTWNELENVVIKNPFRSFVDKKLRKEVFIEEILELRKTRPGDISSIKTKADNIILDIKENLKNEITNIEDKCYYNAFLEYFKNVNGDSTEYDRIRIKYNPTIHTQTERRNKEWAEKRRFELSKIEKLMKEEKSKDR